MKITRPKRGRAGAKRMDLTDMRELFRDRRVWSGIGIVIEPEGAAHWSIVSNAAGTAVDVLIEVELQPSKVHVSCRLPRGVWQVPNPGDEVAVLIPDGQLDFQPLIVCSLSSGTVPIVEGPDPTRIVIVPPSGGTVLIHDGNGGTEPLVKRSEYNGHTHGPGTFTNGSGAVTGISGGADDVTGTEVLKAK